MSTRTSIARITTIAASAVAVVAAIAAVAIGFTGWPPARAVAAPMWAPASTMTTGTAMLGVDESTVVTLGPEVSTEDKFDAAQGGLSKSSHKRLTATAAKKKAKIVVKRKAVKRVARASSGVSTNGGGWSSARVSWYGPGFYGNGMAGGGTLQPDSMVVAHRSLPFGTKVKFKYHGKAVTAVVKDRGPYVSGRTFDLGPGTAKALGFSGVGTVQYRIVR